MQASSGGGLFLDCSVLPLLGIFTMLLPSEIEDVGFLLISWSSSGSPRFRSRPFEFCMIRSVCQLVSASSVDVKT